MIKEVKREIRILAFDDGPFKPRSQGKVILIGVVFRGGEFMDGLLKTEVEIDGNDAEHRIIDITNKTKHKDQLRVIMLDGITFGGFNTVNIKNINYATGLPVVVVSRKKPNLEEFKSALSKLENRKDRLKAVEDAGPVYPAGKVCFQCVGIDIKDAERVIKTASTRSDIPEPLRVAHLIASGVVLGESVGRA